MLEQTRIGSTKRTVYIQTSMTMVLSKLPVTTMVEDKNKDEQNVEIPHSELFYLNSEFCMGYLLPKRF